MAEPPRFTRENLQEGDTGTWDEDGYLHSFKDEPGLISQKNHVKEWFDRGAFHRGKDLPAVIYSRRKIWKFRGRTRRICGPAQIYDARNLETSIPTTKLVWTWLLDDTLYFSH